MELRVFCYRKVSLVLLSYRYLKSLKEESRQISIIIFYNIEKNSKKYAKNIYKDTNVCYADAVYAISLYNVWIGSISGDLFFTTIFYFILPLAATLPFSFSLSDESKSGYLRQMTLKKGQMRYYFAKYIVTFTSGFLLAAIPLLINVIITACYIPAYKPDPLEQLYSGQYYGQYLANIFYSEPFAFMIIFILIPGLFCGLWADLSMCLSFFIKNKFFVVIIPYLFLFFEKAFFDSLFSNRIALDLSPFYFMRGESSGNIVIVTIILITMLGVTLFITWFRGWRDDVY